MRKHRYAPQGLLALNPEAFFFLFDAPPEPEVERAGDVALVTIRGPLEHHKKWWGDSYEAIATRVAEALATGPSAVVLVVDSPGGVVSGCFDAARAIRAAAANADVPLYAWIEGQACSAAYALATAAERVFASETAMVGSIGVIEALVDRREQQTMFGIDVTLVTSGARKGDGHPAAEVTSDTRAAAQRRVDELASAFFALVEQHRGVAAEEVQALEARIVLGAEAKELGLVDEVATFDQVLAAASGREEPDMAAKATKDMDDARATLRKLAESDNDEEAKKAKKALAAMDDDDEEKAEDDKDEDKSKSKAEDEKKESKSKGKAMDDDEDKSKSKAEDEEKDDDAKASSSLKLAARIQQLEAAAAARAKADKKAAEDQEREELLASRPDFAPEALEVLRSAPLATVKEAVEKWPRGAVRIRNNTLAASAQPGATRGADQASGRVDHLPPDEAAELDRQMGLRRDVDAIKHEGTTMSLGVMTKTEARALAKRRAEGTQSTDA